MRLVRKTVLVVLPFVLILLLLTGCGNIFPAGKYYIESVDGEAIEKRLAESLKEQGIAIEEYLSSHDLKTANEVLTWEFRKDGSVTGTAGGIEQNRGSWQQNGDRIYVTTEEGTVIEFTINGNKLILNEPEFQKLVFAKK